MSVRGTYITTNLSVGDRNRLRWLDVNSTFTCNGKPSNPVYDWKMEQLRSATIETPLPPIRVSQMGPEDNPTYEIGDGNHRLAIMREWGATEIYAIVGNPELIPRVPLRDIDPLDLGYMRIRAGIPLFHFGDMQLQQPHNDQLLAMMKPDVHHDRNEFKYRVIPSRSLNLCLLISSTNGIRMEFAGPAILNRHRDLPEVLPENLGYDIHHFNNNELRDELFEILSSQYRCDGWVTSFDAGMNMDVCLFPNAVLDCEFELVGPDYIHHAPTNGITLTIGLDVEIDSLSQFIRNVEDCYIEEDDVLDLHEFVRIIKDVDHQTLLKLYLQRSVAGIVDTR